MKTRWKSLMVAVCSMMIISTTAYAIDKNVLVGNTRFETATEVSEYGFEQSSNIVLVNGESIADALSATPFAKLKEAPILLTEKDRLTDVTKSEIKRLKASNIYIIGGKGVVSDNVVSELKKIGYSVYRIYGQNRYETSLNVAKEIDKIKSVSEVAVVNGYNGLADALSVASPAAIRSMPIILSSIDELGSAEKWINSKSIKKSYIIGGEGVISRYLESNLKNPQRIYGVNRWKTNARVLEHFFNQTELYNIYLAKDGAAKTSELVDALAAGPIAAKQNSPVMLVGDKLDVWQEEYLKPRNAKSITQVGGGVSINSIEGVIKALNFKEVNETEVSYVDYLNCQQIEIYFGSSIDKDSVIQNGKLRKDAIEITARDNSVEGEITGLDEFSARLEENNKKLVITRDLSTEKIFNGTYTIRVTDKIRTEKGYPVEPYVIELQIRDTVRPQVKNVVYDDVYGNLSISFTKPIKNFPVITIDGKKVTEDNNVEFLETRDKVILKRDKLNELQSIGKTVQVIVYGGTDYRNLEMIRHASSLRLVKPGEERKVEEVKIKNAKEFTITFASPVDQATVVDANGKILKSNLKITSEGTGHDKNSQITSGDELYGTFSPDKRTLTVKREFNNDKNFNGKYRVVVTSSVRTNDGADFVPYDGAIELHDNLNPEVISTMYDSVNGVVKIIFSEPLKTKPTITIKGGLLGNKPAEEFNTTSELLLNETNKSMITISYNALKIHRLVDTDYPDGTTYKLTIKNATDFKDNKQVEDQYVDRDIHIKPIYEGFKVDKVVELNTDNKPGINEYLVYFNEKIFRPSVDNFSIEGIAEKASDVMLVTNPETNVSDQKVAKVIFGNGYVNKGNTITGLADQTLVIKDVKAQSGAILAENVANVTVRDNTSPKLIEATLKDNSDDDNIVELNLRFSEPVKLKDTSMDQLTTLQQTFDFESEIKYLDYTGKVSNVKLGTNQLNDLKETVYDKESITYKFRKDSVEIIDNVNNVKGFNQLIAGSGFKVIARPAQSFKDENGVSFNANKDGNELKDKDIPTSVEVKRKNIYIGYISQSDPYRDTHGELGYNIWFSEQPNIYGSTVDIEYRYKDRDNRINQKDIEYNSKDENIGKLSFKKNSIDLGGIGGNVEGNMTIKDVYAKNGSGNMLNSVPIDRVKLRDNMEVVLQNAKFNASTSSLELKFSDNVDSETVKNYFANSMNMNSNGSSLTKYPIIESVNPANVPAKEITIKFDLNLASTESKNAIRDEFLNFIMNEDLKLKTLSSTSKGYIKDTRGWQIKPDTNIDIIQDNKLAYSIENINATSDVEISSIDYEYDSSEKYLIFTFTGEVNKESVEHGWMNTIKINRGNERLINFPTSSSEKIDGNKVKLTLAGGNLDAFHSFMIVNSTISATTGYYPMQANGSNAYNLITDNTGTLIHSKKPGSILIINVNNLDGNTDTP